MRVSGLILAGGRGQRMQGRDKGWVRLANKPMIEWIIDRLQPQVDELIINANRTINRYKQLNYPVIEDEAKGFHGPLAGILSGLKACKNELLVYVPCDTPFFPDDLVASMLEKQQAASAEIVSISDGERTHPVFALIKTSLQQSLQEYLESGQRKIDCWYQQHDYQLLEYPGGQNFFENINTQEQLLAAEHRIQNNVD